MMEWKAAVEKTITEFLADTEMRRFASSRFPGTPSRPIPVVLDLRFEPVPGNNGLRQLRVSDIEYADDFVPFVMPATPGDATATRVQIERGWWPRHCVPGVVVDRFLRRVFEHYREVPNATDR